MDCSLSNMQYTYWKPVIMVGERRVYKRMEQLTQ